MKTLTRLPRRTQVEPLQPGDFDDVFTAHVNAKRRSADLLDAAWTLRKPLLLVLAFHGALIVFAVWLVR